MTPPTQLDKIRNIDDIPTQLTQVSTLITELEQTLAEARKLRDDAIKRYRATTSLKIAEIAEAAGVSVATVKAVLR